MRANMNVFQIFLILACLITLADLVKANPLPTAVVTGTATSTSDLDSALGEATKIIEEKTENGNHPEAACADPDDCCMLDFTHISCDEHAQPTCDDNGCGPVPRTIGFGYAGLGTQICVNALDNDGNPTIYDQFSISHCTAQIDSVHLYTGNNCEGSNWNQINIAACYTSGGGIGSFKIVVVPDHKRDILAGALMNESDPLSTSEYPLQGNVASVTPAEDCFDDETGTYILGCKIERDVAPAPLTPPLCPGWPGWVLKDDCIIKPAVDHRGSEEFVCYNALEKK